MWAVHLPSVLPVESGAFAPAGHQDYGTQRSAQLLSPTDAVRKKCAKNLSKVTVSFDAEWPSPFSCVQSAIVTAAPVMFRLLW